MNTSEQINELAAALAKAQGAFANAEKDGKNPHLGNRYVTLTSVWDAIRKPLSDNGLAVVQVTDTDHDGAITLITRLVHASGQWIEATYPVIGTEGRGINAAQAMGSALTYARRYSLTALVGAVADEDDDASAATGKQPQRQPQASKPASQPAKPFVPADIASDVEFDNLPSASQERAATAASNGKAKHNPDAPWDDARKAEAVRWAMSKYPGVFKHPNHAMNSLDNLLEECAAKGMTASEIAAAWKDKVYGKFLDMQAAADETPLAERFEAQA